MSDATNRGTTPGTGIRPNGRPDRGVKGVPGNGANAFAGAFGGTDRSLGDAGPDHRPGADHRPDVGHRSDAGRGPGADERADGSRPSGRRASPAAPAPSSSRPPGGASPGRRLTIGVKLAVLTGGLVGVLVISSVLLIQQTRNTSGSYDRLLTGPVAQSLKARQMQVEFKKQVQEWKDILLRGSNPADMTTYLGNFHAQDLRVNQLNADMLASSQDPALTTQLARFRDAHRQLDADYARALTLFQSADGTNPAAADKLVRGLDRPPTDLIDGVVQQLETSVADDVARQAAETDTRNKATLVTGTGLLLVLLGVLAIAILNIVRPIRRLTRQALASATERLPGAIAHIKTMDATAEPPTLPGFVVTTNDELRELGDAFTTLQDSALRLAVEQHRADRERADMLVNLGRRNQNLLGRMLGYVTDLERQEQDPDVLSQLFRLDHATTRIRRNAESMLVLAGATQTRTWSRPVPVIDVVRAALSEIEEYIRVDLHHVEDGLVNGTAVADVVHLVAELVENATHFSPPTTQVTVIGQSVREGYRLRVIDQGVGMTRRELDDANQRIQRADSGWADAKLLGLYVVGRLARRRGIQVALEASAGRGITGSVLLPASLLAGRSDGPGAAAPTSGAPELPGPRDRIVDLTAAGPHGDDARSGAVPVGGGRTSPYPVLPPAARDGGSPGYGGTAHSSDTSYSSAYGSGFSNGSAFGDGNDFGDGSGFGPGTGYSNGTPGNPYAVPPVPTPAAVTAAPVTAAPAPAPTATAAVPRRVRGAQLPDLGPTDEPVVARPEEGPGAPESLRWQLRSFQLDVQAARRAISETDDHLDQDHHRPEGQ